MKELSSEVRTFTAIQAQVLSGESVAVSGQPIDRRGFEGGVISCVTGNVGGDVNPTRFGVTFKLMESDSETTGYTAISGATLTYSGTPAACANRLSGEINVDLRDKKRYIMAVAEPTFTAGTNPTLEVAAVVVLGQASITPV